LITFVVACVLVIAVVGFTLLVRQKDLPEPEPVSPTLHLEEKKKAIYDGLRDLQFEYRMGKLSDEDYSSTKLELQRQLAVVLSEIDKIKARIAQAPAGVAAPVTAAPIAVAPEPPQPAARAVELHSAVCICPNCLAEFPQPMKFCGECGQAIPATS
jgi:hypothetical protein